MTSKIIYTANRMRLLILFLLMASFAGKAYSFPPDSLKASDYPIDDPRNPGCPCHKYQELADKEYATLLKKRSKNHYVEDASAFSESKELIKNTNRHEKGISFSAEGKSSETHAHRIFYPGKKRETPSNHTQSLVTDKLKRKSLTTFFGSARSGKDKKTSHHKSRHSSKHKGLWKRKTRIDSCTHW